MPLQTLRLLRGDTGTYNTADMDTDSQGLVIDLDTLVKENVIQRCPLLGLMATLDINTRFSYYI